MAKVKFSALISEMRNKLNGSVFARNRGGNYLRNKVTPVNPSTASQVLARARLASFAQSWRGLTEAQRESWRSVVDQWTGTDIFGDAVTPSGSALYTRLNINVAIAGGAPLTTPPNPVGAVAVTDLSLTAAVTGDVLDLTFAPSAVPADHALFVETTPNLSPGIFNANNRFRRIDTLAAAATSPADIFAAQVAKFGGIVEGQKVFARAKFIRLDTGEVSQRLVASTIVAG